MSEQNSPHRVEVNVDDAVAFFWAVFDAYMSMHGGGPRTIAKFLDLDPDAFDAPIKKILHSQEFRKFVVDAERDLAASVVDRFKRKAHAFAERMEQIALTSGDIRSAVTALKDLLDRAETGGTRKVAITTPSTYKRIIEELAEKPDGKEVVDESPVGSEPAPSGGETEPSAPAAS